MRHRADEIGERRILFLDGYDSFTNNIVSLLKEALGSHVVVHVVRMDLWTLSGEGDGHGERRWTQQQFVERLRHFDAVVCGPGPGSPLHEADVGVFRLLWALPRDQAVPVLGICLGFQSLVAHLGGRIRRLPRGGLHGMVRDIDHVRHAPADVFDGVAAFRATLYHSLCADVGQDAIADQLWPASRWERPACAPDLKPLAWAVEPSHAPCQPAQRILMAARHASKPLWGIQYHPESVCTEPAAHRVLSNWFRHALKWNEAMRPKVDRSVYYPDTLSPRAPPMPPLAQLPACPWWQDMQSGLARSALAPRYLARQFKAPAGLDTAEVAEALGLGQADAIVLDSSSTVTGDPLARSSIIALRVDEALRFEYRVGDNYLGLRKPATSLSKPQCQKIRLLDAHHGPSSPWHVLSEFWRCRRVPEVPAQSPTFKGGFMGFVTYEMGLSTLSPGLVPADRGHRRPDICMVWVSKSIVIDHQAGLVHVQMLSTTCADDAWMDETVKTLQSSHAWKHPGCSHRDLTPPSTHSSQELLDHVQNDATTLDFCLPKPRDYEQNVRLCQNAIGDGESYELCFTAQTTMTRPPPQDLHHHPSSPRLARHHTKNPHGAMSRHATPWHIFRTLRSRQPAPFGSFVRLGGATIISSSPERFLTSNSQGLCSMRPMKGTVRKSEAVSTLAEAEKILHVPKEEAENLMIVDLVRHDLHGICGAGSVTVPDLLRVEEYASVFQMITAVNGQLPAHKLHQGTDACLGQLPFGGIDILAAALPPGSMTGAPKKRSCEILHALEPSERSIYSGVVGYLDVCGQADWSVTIRTMFRWDDETAPPQEGETQPREVWRIGAGGAVTALSTPEGEREEMLTKLCGPLGVLADVA
ncbi:hypothetical protein CDD82_4916 [Ophiocordyceps australis]|uniref:aminodeoxychorismate synthase n=1 Tax=Ophiocordyceps australis TaxID=1399860 RepID=A0A2C5Z3U7_9HYPO|nr:hypothetical protein CDD82_4916 [Ophiocordyceps australis]